MRFFHLSDLHIGLKLYNRDLREDQEYILNRIVTLAEEERPDAVVIAGDIYDKAVPSAEAVELFDRFLSALREAVPEAAVMLISGNHDSAPRVNCFRNILARQNLYMIGTPPQRESESIQQVTLGDEFGPVHFYLLPFVKPSMVKAMTGTDENGNNLSYDETLKRLIGREEIRREDRNVLVSHQFYLPAGKNAEEVERMDSEVRTVGNIDRVEASVLEPFDYAALGHIHKPMKVGEENFRYCGTPLACSVSEAGQKKGIILVEMREKGTVETRVLPLVPLRQIRVIRGTLPEILEEASEDYVTAILTDEPDEKTDTRDRLQAAFPHLLEIRRERTEQNPEWEENPLPEALEPLELCLEFLSDADDETMEILQDVLRTVQEGGQV